MLVTVMLSLLTSQAALNCFPVLFQEWVLLWLECLYQGHVKILIRTSILQNFDSILTASFNLSYHFKGPVSKYSYMGS
jgi:hypothetical protein